MKQKNYSEWQKFIGLQDTIIKRMNIINLGDSVIKKKCDKNKLIN